MQVRSDYVSLPVQARVASGYSRNRALNAELQSHEGAGHGAGPWLLVCECGRNDCAETVELTNVEYDAVRSHNRLYVVAPGHGYPGVTSAVTAVPGRFEVVELLHVVNEEQSEG